jgi:hypothetical protein
MKNKKRQNAIKNKPVERILVGTYLIMAIMIAIPFVIVEQIYHRLVKILENLQGSD